MHTQHASGGSAEKNILTSSTEGNEVCMYGRATSWLFAGAVQVAADQ